MRQDQPAVEREYFIRETIYACYGAATVAASIATFGAGGVAIGLLLTAFWACLFELRSRWSRAILMISLTFIGLLFLLPPLHGPGHREATWRMSCSNNLKSIARALHNYHDVYKSFPPTYVLGEDGQRMHSWRVLILPFLEDEQQLYNAYNFAEPWDGPSNRELILQMPRVFCCPSQCRFGSEPKGLTNYFAVVGENTAWPGERTMGFRDITDGTSNTLLLLEVAHSTTAWTEPADIEYVDALDLLTSDQLAPHRYGGTQFFYDQRGGCQIALVDGLVYFVTQQANQVASELLITRSDGKRFRVDDLQNNVASSRPLRVGNCIRLGVFLLLAICPLPWVWISPRRTRAAMHSCDATNRRADLGD